MSPLLEVRNLNAGYRLGSLVVHAVRDLSLTLGHSEFLGVAGESGCGKSTMAFSITRMLEPPGQLFSGEVLLEGTDLLKLPGEELRGMRWRDFSIVMQASMNVLNPVMKIRGQIFDTITAHGNAFHGKLEERAAELLKLTGVAPRYLDAYPFQLSGGMRQRVAIAMALSLNPKLIIMDEPTTALDVVVQRRILQEIEGLKRLFGFSIIFITHDLSILVEISDTIAIMYAGAIVEQAPAARLYAHPLHPYTSGLMGSFPPLAGKRVRRHGIPGYPPNLAQKIRGCPFFPRCPQGIPGVCDQFRPQPLLIQEDHMVACHLYGDGGTQKT